MPHLVGGEFSWQSVYKPGSVENNHLSSTYVTIRIERVSAHERITLLCAPPCSQQGLPPPHVTMRRCSLLHYSFHPYLRNLKRLG